ncbi:MAG: DUF370 domain-containing protein [Tissierellia bacterium]|jgi:hypothetical protein|nr:DUF370 domain-containing protein [Tissierellia bacterium]
MFIHIGDNISILKKDIILILDKSTIRKSKTSKTFIESLIEDGSLVNLDDDNVKTYIIALEKNQRTRRKDKSKIKLYTSNISSRSLFNREKTNV